MTRRRKLWTSCNTVQLLFVSLCTAQSVGAGAHAGATDAEEPVRITVQVSKLCETNVLLTLEMRNAGSNDVVIPFCYLPWDRYAMTLAVVETDTYSTALKQELTVADPVTGTPWKITKGQKLVGSIDLTDRFPDLAKVLERNDVIVFWSYTLPGDTGRTQRLSGSLHIPEQAKSKKH